MSRSERSLNVDLGERSYPIYIGAGLLGDPELYRRHIPAHQVVVVTNETVGPLYLAPVLAGLAGFQVEQVVLPDGERYKNLETWQGIFDALLRARFNRQCTVLALGGGVVGDMAGFAAACYQRGVHFVQAPTTLLAQVDSSVGGKTGINHPLGKNMIGAFYQPRCVIADTATLDTLDHRQLAAGLAEVIKYGLIDDPEFFVWLEGHIEALLRRDPEALAYAIEPGVEALSGLFMLVVMLLVGASQAMSWVLAYERIPQMVSEAMLALSANPLMVLLLINVLLLVVGTFMDMTPAVLIFTPRRRRPTRARAIAIRWSS